MTPLQKAGLYLLCIPVGITLGIFLGAFLDKLSDALRTYRATGNRDEVIALCLAFLAVTSGLIGIACFVGAYILSL